MKVKAASQKNQLTWPSPLKTELGIIEGFYGAPYTIPEREALLESLPQLGYGFYIYAPKNDPLLRRRWQDELEDCSIQTLSSLKESCHLAGIKSGVGLSPLGLGAEYETLKERLWRKSEEICAVLKPEIFALLFDDIKNDDPHSGFRQNRAVRELRERLPSCVQTLIFCPAYYSFDPILDKIFGARPEHYFEELTEGLDPDTLVFWTGNKVISESIATGDLTKPRELLGDRLALWDNYPVNDSKKLADRLLLQPFTGRGGLDGQVRMHAVNPLLQSALNPLPLCTLPALYRGESSESIKLLWQRQGQQLFGTELFRQISPALLQLQRTGRAELAEEIRHTLENALGGPDTKVCSALTQLADFLAGRWQFDPACLTS